ncbi:MAG: M28 family peptidase, partial [Verrucomicrobia bacterium]|nr:M28 family peptidase [Verrucomicrobiota bacterium]
DCMLASKRTPAAFAAATNGFVVLHDDGQHWVVRAPGAEAEPLADLGFALRRLPADPIQFATATTPAHVAPMRAETLMSGTPHPLVSEMVSCLSTNRLHALMRRLTGIEATVAAGDLAAIASRKTTSGTHIYRATQMAHDHLQSLGLTASLQPWSGGGYSGRNVVATQTGTVRPAEIVVIVAHLDDQPNTSNSPGADDNASGSAAVLAAAGLFRPYRFERTIRYLLVTGEEQGLYGSAAHAAAAAAAGDNIVAVFNMDMIAWDSDDDGALDLYTRPPGSPGYAADLAIASAFTNAVALYGLAGVLRPEIIANGEDASDHSSFWDRGYPGVLAIEDIGDFNTHYHTTGDSLASLDPSWNYFVRFVRASLATVAGLAVPVDRAPFDAVEVALATDAPSNGTGAGVLIARHEAGTTESGADGRDIAATALPANTNAQSFGVATAPYGTALGRDARPTNSATVFDLALSAASPAGTTFDSAPRLRFDFLSPPDSNRTYLVRIRIDRQYTGAATNFEAVVDLRTVVDAGGWLALPALTGLGGGASFGTCDVATRFVDRGSSNCIFAAIAGGRQLALESPAQTGTRVRDELHVSTNLLMPGGWMPAGVFTSDVPADAASFDSGFRRLSRPVAAPSLTNAPARHFRLLRTWLAP